jgi:hypothetical protein
VMLQITSKSLQDEVNLFTIPKKSALELKWKTRYFASYILLANFYPEGRF